MTAAWWWIVLGVSAALVVLVAADMIRRTSVRLARSGADAVRLRGPFGLRLVIGPRRGVSRVVSGDAS